RPLVKLSPTSYLEPRVDKHNLLLGGYSDLEIPSLWSTGGGGYEDGGSGGDGNAAGAMHPARRSPTEGGDSEVSVDGDGVGMARSLSTSASGGRDMEVCGRIVILALVVVVSVEGGAVSSVSEAGTPMHTLAHGGSKAHGVLSGLTLPNEPKPLGQHRPPLPRSILSPGEAYKSWVSCSWSSVSSVTLVLTFSKVVGAISGTASAGSIQYRQTHSLPLVELSPTSYLEPRVDKHNLLRGGCSDSGISYLRSTGGGGYKDGGSGGDGNAAGAVHLARRSPAEGGDSEVSGNSDGVCMARSLSTSASSGRDMEVCGRIVILALVVAVSMKGGGMMGYVPLGGEASSSIGITTAESARAKCSS
nr:hypothetical protein [Tanacetum cinerariifolium]